MLYHWIEQFLYPYLKLKELLYKSKRETIRITIVFIISITKLGWFLGNGLLMTCHQATLHTVQICCHSDYLLMAVIHIYRHGGLRFFRRNLKKIATPPIGRRKKSRPPLSDQEKNHDPPCSRLICDILVFATKLHFPFSYFQITYSWSLNSIQFWQLPKILNKGIF